MRRGLFHSFCKTFFGMSQEHTIYCMCIHASAFVTFFLVNDRFLWVFQDFANLLEYSISGGTALILFLVSLGLGTYLTFELNDRFHYDFEECFMAVLMVPILTMISAAVLMVAWRVITLTMAILFHLAWSFLKAMFT